MNPTDQSLSTALADVVRAQQLLTAFHRRARALLREVQVALLDTEPSLHLLPTGSGGDVYSPSHLTLDQPDGWLRRWIAVFFTEERFVAARDTGEPHEDLRLAYLLLNTDPSSVAEAELDLVLLHDVQGVQGALQPWLNAMWNRGLFDLDIPADGWYGRPDAIDLGLGASMRLQVRRVPLSRVVDREALIREVVEPLVQRYREPVPGPA